MHQNEEGTLRKLSRRDRGFKKSKTKDDLFEWNRYCRKSEEHRKKLENSKPDIVDRINEHIRLEKEKERQENQRKDEWYWTSSDNEYEDEDDDYCTINTKEENERYEEEDRKWREAEENSRKQKVKEKRQKEREKLKEAIARPIDPLPERELCQYEQIREDIIRERKEAMERFNFYEDLKKTKEEIGFIPKRFQDEKDI